MAELSGLFQNLGPTGGALMSGLTTGQDLVSAAQQDEMRKAQMEEILQRTANQKELAPLELQAKKQAVASGELKAKQEAQDYRDEILGKAIPQLKGLKGPARLAEYERIFTQAGMPLDEVDRQRMYQQDPDKFLAELEARHKWSIEQRPAYRQAIDTANIQAKSHTQGINAQISAQKDLEQMRIDAGKYNKNKVATDVNSALLKPISSAQKAEILESAYYAAEAANDMVMANQYKQRAQQARARAAEDARNRAAGAPGTMGYADEQGNIDIQNKPAPAANAPIAGGPALGTAANPIVLK